MEWDDLFLKWKNAWGRPGNEGQVCLEAARHRVNHNTPEDWQWLLEALQAPARRRFVGRVFARLSVPRRFFEPFMHAAVHEEDPSLNELFITPCIRTWNARRVIERLFEYLQNGTNEEKAGAVSAMYWAFVRGRNEAIGDLRRRRHNAFLREFVENEDVNVRCRIIPMLELQDASVYDEEVRHLVPKAIEIARGHEEEYIRSRVELQLGATGPLMAIPSRRATLLSRLFHWRHIRN